MAKSPQQVAKDMLQAFEEFEQWVQSTFIKNSVETIAKDRKEGFMAGKGPKGESWPALKPATVRSKSGQHKTTRVKRKGGISGLSTAESKPAKYPSKPLIDTGAMMNATTHVKKGRGEVRMARSRGEAVTGGFESIAAIHDKGLGNNPPRPHWGIYKQSRANIWRAWKERVRMLAKRMMR
jgi:hypothetical protein